MPDLVYVSRLARLPVLDPEGGTLGRVDDVVVGGPARGAPPPVLGFVAAVPGRRIFIGAGRVVSVDPTGLRLRTGAINLRRFGARPGETLVRHDLFDHAIPGTDDRVNDVAFRQASGRARGWELASVSLVPGTRRGLRSPRRRRHSASWEVLRPLLSRHDGFGHLRDLHPVELAASLQNLSPIERAKAAGALDDEQLADLMEELPEDVQTELIEGIELERAADVLEAMAPDDAADLLGELGGKRRTELLAAMEPDEAEPLRRLLRHASDTAGGLMTPEPIVLPPFATVAEALARLRDPDLPAAVAGQVFVAEPPTETPTGRFIGTASFQRLLREPPGSPVSECAEDEPAPIAPTMDEVSVATRLAAYNLLAVPVCDDAGHLLGAVTVDDVLDRVLPEGWRER